MKRCDLCGEATTCLPREIEGRIFDICETCWKPLAERLEGKGHRSQFLDDLDHMPEYEETVY